MDKLNFINIITVTYPEILALVITAIAIVGGHNFLLWNNKKDIKRILFSVLVMSISNIFTRIIGTNILEVLLMNIVIYFFVMWLIIKIEWYRAAVGILVSTLFITILELLYMPAAMSIANINHIIIYKSDLLRFLFSAPERLIQFGIAYYCVKKHITIIDLSRVDKMNSLNKLKLSLISALMFCTMVLIAVYAKLFMYSTVFLKDSKAVLASIVWSLVLFSVVVVLMVSLYKTSKQACSEQENNYITRQQYTQMLCNIHYHLSGGNVDKAKSLVRQNIFSNTDNTSETKRQIAN